MMSVEKRDFLWLNIRSLPYFRGLLRAIEAKFYQQFELPQPVLDLGCGDGHFAGITFKDGLDVGIDPWIGPVKKARRENAHRLVILGDGECLPFPTGHFKSVISNSVLEHIPDVEKVLKELSRVTSPDAIFLFCVPNHMFLENLSISKFFDRLGLKFLGSAYRTFFNRISRHHHCDDPDTWNHRLEECGFTVEKWWHYFSPGAFRTLEWGHYLGLPALICHFLFGKWILVPEKWNLAVIEQWLRRYYEESPVQDNGSYTFFVARRM